VIEELVDIQRGRPIFPGSGFGDLVFLNEEGPVPPPRRNGHAEMAEVPCEDQSLAGGSHRHHQTIDEI